jgi:hypothetical protein
MVLGAQAPGRVGRRPVFSCEPLSRLALFPSHRSTAAAAFLLGTGVRVRHVGRGRLSWAKAYGAVPAGHITGVVSVPSFASRSCSGGWVRNMRVSRESANGSTG